MRALVIAAVISLACCLLPSKRPGQYLQTRSLGGKQLDRELRLLEVSLRATLAEINEAHRRMPALIHPDRGGSTAKLAEVNAARDLLLAQLPLTTLDQEPPEGRNKLSIRP